MIHSLEDLTPATEWDETVWSRATEEELSTHTETGRLCVATLLPFSGGQPDWQGFERSVQWMIECGQAYDTELAFVLNADTGYLFNLSLDLYEEVLRRFRSSFPETPVIAGVTAVGCEGEEFHADTYRHHLDRLQQFKHVEAMIMTSQSLNALEDQARRDAYFQIAEHITVPALVHALEPAFVPWATPFRPWLLKELAGHEKFVGGKVSTLDEPHFLYWSAMCRGANLDFSPHSGDDYGIASAIKMGHPLLIGAGVSACPLICAAKKLWLQGSYDPRVYKLLEAIQSLEDTVFRLDERGSAAAYKHSTAVILKLLGLIQSSEVHPDCADKRSGDEMARMREALQRPLRIAQRLGIENFSPQN